MRYVLGLDIGIASVGWAVLNLDEKRVERLGVRAFSAAENPKDGAPLAQPRRLARSARRRLRRRRGRLVRAKDLFVRHGLIPAAARETAFTTAADRPSPWELRAVGLDRLLDGEELARALFHIVKRRGFQPNRRREMAAEEPTGRRKGKEPSAADNDDDAKAKAAVLHNRQVLAEGRYRTPGEMFWCDEAYAGRKRNSAGLYQGCVERAALEEEIRRLCAAQRSLGSEFAGESFEAELVEIFAWQRPFATGEDILAKVGACELEPGERRAPRHAYHAERFLLLQAINNLTWTVDGERCRADAGQRKMLADLAYTHVRLTWGQVRKALDLPDGARFTKLSYRGRSGEETLDPEKGTFIALRGYHALKKACEGAGVWERVSADPDLMDRLAIALTFYKTDEQISQYLAEAGVEAPIIQAALACETFSKVIHLSLSAVKKLEPHLQAGLVYTAACEAAYPGAGRRFAPQDRLPVIPRDLTTNPVVFRALTQARKVLNAVVGLYGAPHAVHIEMARDLGRSWEDRRKLERRRDENEADRRRLEEQFKDIFGREPGRGDLRKFRLYREQGGQCAYSQQPIDLQRLCEPGYVEEDHVIPYSRSFDDTVANRVLVLTAQNRNKRNQTPHEWFGGADPARWEAFAAWVRASVRDTRKRERLLKEKFTDDTAEDWKVRNLTDTRYIARAFAKFVRERLRFAETAAPQTVVCPSGSVTARTRGLWGLNKTRDDDLHHAADAAVVAALQQGMIQRITLHAQVAETRVAEVDRETGEVLAWRENRPPRLPEPWPGFAQEVRERLADPALLVSRMPQRRLRGEIHAATIRAVRRDAEGEQVAISRMPLQKVTPKHLPLLCAKENDRLLYQAIEGRLAESGGDPKKAFAEPLRKPGRDGTPGAVVRTVRLRERQPSGVHVRGGVADNGDMARCDVYCRQGRYYLVPVYVADIMAGRLPRRAIRPAKGEAQWPLMAEAEFAFSLHPYDLVAVTPKAAAEPTLGYYLTVDRANGRLWLKPPNGGETVRISTSTADAIEKYEVTVLGDRHPVRRERRHGVADGGGEQPGPPAGGA